MSQVWMITGSAGGIGAGIAKAALAAGHRVFATDSNLERLHLTYARMGENVFTAQLDIRDPMQAHGVVDAVLARFSHIDVLVNNAGYGQFGPFEEVDPAAVENQFATNVLGTFNVTRAVLPVMRKSRSGHIINMSSNGGFKGVAGASMYSATKFAIEGFSESLAEEIADFGIKVTVVEPGAFRTDFLDSRSLKQGSVSIDDYADYRIKANTVFQARNHHQVGDPHKLGQAIVQLVASEHPPFRFVAGRDALKVVENKLQSVHDEVARWRDLSTSTDFEMDK